MQDNPSFTIRFLDLSDIEQVVALSDSEGWNQTDKDWRILIGNSRNTCIAAVHEGRLIGTATALNHSDQLAWIGMVIVRKEFRSQGIGRALLARIIDELKGFDSIKLDARPDGIHLYHKLGFIDEYEICRMATSSFRGTSVEIGEEKPDLINSEDLSEIIKSDSEVFGANRSYLLHALFSGFPGKAYRLIRGNVLAGYTFGREGKRYNYIGPLSADSDDSCRIILLKALGTLINKPVALDIVSRRADMILWLESHGFEKQNFYVRMFFKSNCYSGNTRYQYLISGPEFG